MRRYRPANSPAFVYSLVDPRSREIKYVGSSIHVGRRLKQHIDGVRQGRDNSVKGLWIADVLASGFRPVLIIIERTTFRDCLAREKYWTEDYQRRGAPLTNTSRIGDSPKNAFVSEDSTTLRSRGFDILCQRMIETGKYIHFEDIALRYGLKRSTVELFLHERHSDISHVTIGQSWCIADALGVSLEDLVVDDTPLHRKEPAS